MYHSNHTLFIVSAGTMKSNVIKFLIIIIINIKKSCRIIIKLSVVRCTIIIINTIMVTVIIIDIIKSCSITIKLPVVEFFTVAITIANIIATIISIIIIFINNIKLLLADVAELLLYDYCMFQSPYLPMATFPFLIVDYFCCILF